MPRVRFEQVRVKTQVFFVYVDWTTEETPRPFYVGKGNEARIRVKKRNQHHTRLANRYGWHREVVFATKDEQVAFDLEMQLIAEHRTFIYEGWGANFSRGGEGPSGYKQSPETRAKHAETSRGRVKSEATRKRLSEARQALLATGWKPSFPDEARNRISKAALAREQRKRETGHVVSQETRERMAASQRVREPYSPELRAKMSQAARVREANKKARGYVVSDESRRKMSESQKARRARQENTKIP